MVKKKFILGSDIGNEAIVCALLDSKNQIVLKPREFANNIAGFEQCLHWLKEAGISLKDLLVCMEHTGVYSESFCYFLYAEKITVVIDSGAKINKSSKLTIHKNDAEDSINIAEYAFRYPDRLTAWKPRDSRVEEVKSLLSTRELYVKQRTSQKNAYTAFKRKVVQNELILRSFRDVIQKFDELIHDIENEIKSILSQNEHWLAIIKDMRTMCGVNKLLPYHIFVISNGFSVKLEYKKLSAYLRICPYEFSSGTSIRKKPRSPKYGPGMMKKLLFLAARNVCQYDLKFKQYYQRKKLEGKEYFIIMNNVSNKILKILCAMINNGKPYIDNYRSVNPNLAN